MVPEPMMPVYRREVYEHGELVDAVKKGFTKYPMKWREELPPLPNLAKLAFTRHREKFQHWPDEALKAITFSEDDLWRTLDLRHLRLKTRKLGHPDRSWKPNSYSFKVLSSVAKTKWQLLMNNTKRVPTQYVSELGDYFTFLSVNDDTLEAI